MYIHDLLWPGWASMEWNLLSKGITISFVDEMFHCVRQSSLGRAWHAITQPSISLLKYCLGYLAAFVTSSVAMFCWACIHLRSTGLLFAQLWRWKWGSTWAGQGHCWLLMSRPLEVKSKRTTGLLFLTGIGDTSWHSSHENVLAMAFSCQGDRGCVSILFHL